MDKAAIINSAIDRLTQLTGADFRIYHDELRAVISNAIEEATGDMKARLADDSVRRALGSLLAAVRSIDSVAKVAESVLSGTQAQEPRP